MSNPTEGGQKVLPPGPRADWRGPAGSLGWGLAWTDYALYRVEHGAVVLSLLLMAVIEFVYILSIYTIEQKIAFLQLQEGRAGVPWALLAVAVFVGAMVKAAVDQSPTLGKTPDGAPKPLGLRLAITAGIFAAVALLGALTLFLEQSYHYYTLLTLLAVVPTCLYFFKKGNHATTAVVGVGSLLTLGLAWGVPEGYSWADKRALFLLLWVGFLGASMAAKERRHIQIDFARKLVPARFLPYHEGVSLLAAAGFTGFLVYLGYLYMFHPDYGRYWIRTIEGEVPEWLVSGVIPASFVLILLRFGLRGLALLIWPSAMTPTPPSTELAAPAPDAPAPQEAP